MSECAEVQWLQGEWIFGTTPKYRARCRTHNYTGPERENRRDARADADRHNRTTESKEN